MERKDHVVLNPSKVLTDLGANGQQNASETARLLGRRERYKTLRCGLPCYRWTSSGLAKQVTPRPLESFQKWKSPYQREKGIGGDEIGSLLKTFGLNTIVRKESKGIYLLPGIDSGL